MFMGSTQRIKAVTNYKEQLAIQKQKLLKALRHLEYSYKKVQNLPENIEKLDEEALETWESFAARFARVAEIFLTRYLRTVALLNDPGFSGTLRDLVNLAEKKGNLPSYTLAPDSLYTSRDVPKALFKSIVPTLAPSLFIIVVIPELKKLSLKKNSILSPPGLCYNSMI